jgi:hypothetical protein
MNKGGRMTLEQIDKQIEELKQKKKEEIKKQKQKELKELREKNAKKRKLESRIKYIIGGYVLKNEPATLQKLLKSEDLRPQDIEAINSYLSL